MNIAQLALTLRVQKSRIRDVLAGTPYERDGHLGQDQLSAEAEALVRQRVSEEPQSPDVPWILEPGDVVRRRDIHLAYDGNKQSGITRLKGTPSIAIFSGKSSGSKHGYDIHEGPQEDGTFAYTGQGTRGDQVFTHGNRALMESGANGEAIRLFTTEGTVATYVGEYALGVPPFRFERIPAADGVTHRTVIVFNLEPVAADAALLSPHTTVPSDQGAQILDWQPPESQAILIPVPAEIPAEATIAARREFKLQAEFGAWLRSHGHDVKRLLLPSDGAPIEPDLFVPSLHWVVEAKRAASRELVRMAIGQVLDYTRVARRNRVAATPVILLPGPPTRDMVELAQDYEIAILVRDGNSGFGRLVTEDSAPQHTLEGTELLSDVLA